MYQIGWEFDDGSVTGRTLLGILRGGVGCGNPKLKDIPKWWMRVSKTIFKSQNIFLVYKKTFEILHTFSWNSKKLKTSQNFH